MRVYPKCGEQYSLRQVFTDLVLRDSPSLNFTFEGVSQNIQDSHLNHEQLLAVAGAADSQWRFVRETDEWIPIFRAVDSEQVLTWVDLTLLIDPYADRAGAMHVTPKGYPTQQYYRLVDGVITSKDGETYTTPTFDEHGRSALSYNPGVCEFCKTQVAKRVEWRDPSESCCRAYEICPDCRTKSNNEMY